MLTFPIGRPNDTKIFSRTLLHRLAFMLGVVCLLGPLAHAQFRTSIQGTVTDPSGAVIPDATLTLLNTATNASVTHKSDAQGIFNFNALPPANFTLTVNHDGFQERVLTNLKLIPEQPNSVNVQLSIATATTVVTVDASTAPAIDTETSNLGGTISSNDIQHMPSYQRDIFTLVQLAPGTISDGSQGGGGGTYNTTAQGWQGPNGSGNSGQAPTENGILANANGGEYSTNSVSIDGISTVSAVWGGTSIITPSQESVDNVRIVTNDYDAENGRFSGAQTFVTSKSGSNQLHGSAFLAIHRPGLNAYQHTIVEPDIITEPLRDEGRFNTYGASIGGPIWKNKVFFFFAYESTPNSSSSTGTGWYDTADFDSSANAGPIAATYLGFTGHEVSQTGVVTAGCASIGLVEGVNCATIAGKGLDIGSPLTTGAGKQDLTALNTIASPGIGNGLDGVADIADYATTSPYNSYYRQYDGRLDADISSKDHLAYSIYWVPQGNTSYNGPARAYNFFNHDQINEAMAGIWNHTFSPTFLNEARANAAGWRWNELAGNPQRPVGLPVATIQVLPIQTFGAGPGSDDNQWTFSYKDVATKVLSRHTLKFGGEVTVLHELADPVNAPSFNFFSLWDFLNDAPYAEYGSFNTTTGTPVVPRDDNRQYLYGFFIQDAWKVRNNLTINAGLRYSYYDSLYDKEDNIGISHFGSGSDLLTGMYIKTGGKIWNPQKGNFGPQVGFNWSPESLHNKVVIRGGYGLTFNQDEVALTANSANNPPTGSYVSFNNSVAPNTIDSRILYALSSSPTSLDGFPSNSNTITSYNTSNLPLAGGGTVTAYPSSIPTQYSSHFSLDVQADLGNSFVGSIGYQGSTTRHLVSEIKNFNASAAVAGIAMNPLVPTVDYYLSGGGANNNAFLAELKHDMAHHISLDAQFEWSKSMDNVSGPYEENGFLFDSAQSYGRSEFNVGKSFKVFGLWQPVFFHGQHGWMEKVAGGWSLSGIFNIHTGFPWTPTFSTGTNLYCNLCSYQNLRPQYKGGAKNDTGNKAFESGSNFAGILDQQDITTATVNGNDGTVVAYANKYFNMPNFQQAVTYSSTGNAPVANAGLPPAPGFARDSFDGPGYKDVDASLTKSFGFPKLRLLGEDAKLEIRADAFNLFNISNLDARSIQSNINTSNFGQDTVLLGSRTISFQARFSF